MTDTQNINSWALLKRLLGTYLPEHKKKLTIALLAMIVVAGCTTTLAYNLKPLFDQGLIGKRVGVLNTIVFILIGVTLIKSVAYYFQAFYMGVIGQNIVASLQKDLYRKVVQQDLTFFYQNTTGTLTARFISDLMRLRMSVMRIFHSGLRDTATIIGLLGNMFYHSWKLTLLAMIIFPLAVIPIRYFGKLSRRYSKINQESTGFLTHILTQSLGHIRQVQSFTMEKHETKRTDAGVNKVLETTIKTERVNAISSPIVETIGITTIAALIMMAGSQIKNDILTPGEFASFVASLVILVRPMKGLTNLNNILQDGLAAAARTFAIMDAPVGISDRIDAQPLTVTEGKITFKDVTFQYPDKTEAIKKLNLDIPAGKFVALVGASGAGKTTILNLIPRFFDPTSGKIFIDGADIKGATLTSLRQNISLVTQDVAIFDDTVTANIAYGKTNATQEEVIQAAKDAAALKFIEEMPEGFNTVLGENGVKLSGGQKQRIAIARALIKNAPILLLDEATSSLDTKSERQVQVALESLMKGRTTLVIAHRLSTITGADMVHVLENGHIIEKGQHDDLLKQQGFYAKLWAMQSKG